LGEFVDNGMALSDNRTAGERIRVSQSSMSEASLSAMAGTYSRLQK
jgi:hypothetical protein